jgi:hypothetical protein
MEPFPFSEQLKAQLEGPPFGETFTVTPADGGEPFEIRGIFDESVLTDEGKKATRPVPRILLYEVPEYESGKTEIIVRGKTFHAQKYEVDANNGAVLYLI